MPNEQNAGRRSPKVRIKDGRFLVTGGASLVGLATVEALLAGGAASIRILDNFSLSAQEAMDHLRADPRVELIKGDVLSLPQLLEASERVDGVVHLAALMSLAMDQDSTSALEINIGGVQNILEACRFNRVQKLILASSVAVYGYGPGVSGDLVETTPFHAPGAAPAAVLYGASKIVGEQLCRAAHRHHGVDYVVLRYATVYGERQHRRAANALYIVDAYDRLKRGERPQVLDGGRETKHYVYVGDVARANCMALESEATDVVLNVSGPAPVTTLELTRMIAELAGRPEIEPELVEPDPSKLRLGSGLPFRIDHQAATRAIGWQPQVDMREGLRRLMAWRDREVARNAL